MIFRGEDGILRISRIRRTPEKRLEIMNEKTFPAVAETDFCGKFDRIDASLIEEPEECRVCSFFCDRDDTCRWPEKAQ